MKKLFTSSFLMLMASSLLAQTVSVDEALQKAEKFLKRSGVATRADLPLKYSYTSAQGDETYYHVFNQGNNQGFIIVGGDAAAQEILGYSDKGSFDYANMPENLRWWLSQYDNEISHAIREVKAGRGKIVKSVMTRGGRANVAPMLTTAWDQVAPYNSQIPTYLNGLLTGNSALATGCVATAGAQVMKYHGWPDTGVGSKTMNRTINGLTFSADFANTHYDWSSMSNTYDNDSYTGSSSDVAVGTLMYHIGVAVDMTYGQIYSGGSSASIKTLAIRLADTFKYDKGLSYETRDFYSDSQWEDMIYSELSHGRPVIYGGSAGENQGHAFVCDGYQDGRWHINWGWGGSCNGSFLLTASSTELALRPAGTGTGGSAENSSYSQDQDIIIGVKPDYAGISLNKKTIYIQTDATFEKATFDRNEQTYFNALMYNGGLTKETFEFVFKLENVADNNDVHVVPADNTLEIDVNSGSGYVYFHIPSTATPGATYHVTPMYKDEFGELQVVKTAPGVIFPSLTIATPEGICIEKRINIKNGGYASSSDLHISFSIKNYTSGNQTKNYILFVFPAGGGNNVDLFDLGSVSLSAGEEKDFVLTYNDLQYKALLVGSDYFIQLCNYTDGQYLPGRADLFFRGVNPISYTLTSAGWGTLCLPYEAAVPSGLTAYTVTGTNGHSLVLEEAETLEMNKPYLLEGASGNYNFSGPITPTGTFTNGLLTASTAADGYAPKYSFVVQNHEGKVGFYKVQDADSQPCRKYHAYLRVSSTASCFSLGGGEPGTTSLDEFESFDELQEVKAYDMYGRPVDPNAKGLVIINGVKRINK